MTRFLCYEYWPCYPDHGRKIDVHRLAAGEQLSDVLDCLPPTVVQWALFSAPSAREARRQFLATARRSERARGGAA